MSNQLIIACISFVLFLILEWVFWLSPAKSFIKALIPNQAFWWWIQPHYLFRLFVLGILLVFARVQLWLLFMGGLNWLSSLGLGVLLIILSFFSLRLSLGYFWQNVQQWYGEDWFSFTKTIAYLFIYPGFVEELMMRWFFPAILWNDFGWWVIIVCPLLNIIWHLPYWIDSFELRGKRMWQGFALNTLLPVTTFAVVLTFVSVLTQNLIGSIFAHVFGDWAGLFLQRTQTRSLTNEKN